MLLSRYKNKKAGIFFLAIYCHFTSNLTRNTLSIILKGGTKKKKKIILLNIKHEYTIQLSILID